jgi:multiple sugar transport system substrate-binding protein
MSYVRSNIPTCFDLALALAMAGCFASGLCGCRQDEPAGVTQIECWYPWGGEEADAMKQMTSAFEAAHPGYRVKLVYAANTLTSSQKLFLAIAGGRPPDVTFVDGQQLAEWAARGALDDITDLVQEAGIGPDDFFGPRWDESTFEDRVYALPWCADPNFAFGWNKKAFREAGLDPERPPRTLKELDEYSDRLTQVAPDGQVLRIGVVPWLWFGNANSLFSWAYCFGGDLYDRPTRKITANSPRVVAALEWMTTYSRKYDVKKVSAFLSTFVGLENNPFYSGRVAMMPVHISTLRYLDRYAPTLEYGLTYMPAAQNGEQKSSWIGGWSMGLPRGVNPAKRRMAFELMRWLCATPEGSAISARSMVLVPAYRESPWFEEARKDWRMAVFIDIVNNSGHVRTLMPAQGYLMDLLNVAVERALYGTQSPQAALDEATRKAQKRLDLLCESRYRRLGDK